MIDNYDLNSDNSNKQKIYKSDFIKSSLPNPDKKDFSSWKKLLLLNKEYKNIKCKKDFSVKEIHVFVTYLTSFPLKIIHLPEEVIFPTL